MPAALGGTLGNWRRLTGPALALGGLVLAGVLFAAEDITVKGKPLPEVYMDKIRKQNLVQGINDDPHSSAALDKLEEIKVQKGKLLIVPKSVQ